MIDSLTEIERQPTPRSVRLAVRPSQLRGALTRVLLGAALAGLAALVLLVTAHASPDAPRNTTGRLTPTTIDLWQYGNGWQCGADMPMANRLLRSCTRDDGAMGVISLSPDLSDWKLVVIEPNAPLGPAPTPVAQSPQPAPSQRRGGG